MARQPASAISSSLPHRTAAPPTKIDDLVTAYQAGITIEVLAARFGIHSATVGKHLHAHGIDTTSAGLLPASPPNSIQP